MCNLSPQTLAAARICTNDAAQSYAGLVDKALAKVQNLEREHAMLLSLADGAYNPEVVKRELTLAKSALGALEAQRDRLLDAVQELNAVETGYPK